MAVDQTFPFEDEEIDSLLATAPEESPSDALKAVPPERLMRRYRGLAENALEVQDLYDAELVRLLHWRIRRLRTIRHAMDYLALALESEARFRLEAKGQKTLDMPDGKVSLRKPPPRLEVTDEDAALVHLRGHPIGDHYVVVKHSLDKRGLKTALEAGELETVPGAEIVRPGTPTVTVRPAGVRPDQWLALQQITKERLPEPGMEADHADDDQS